MARLIIALALLWLALLWLAPQVFASRGPVLPGADVCEWAAHQAAEESGVPFDILGALTLTETGRRMEGAVRPWAWSANAEGEGTWFDDPQSAVAFAEDRVAQGRVNLDIGCFQLNYRWHGEGFASVAQMFDPLENARYAARFVRQLHAETGDWRAAAGAFHSRTPAHAQRYLKRFDELRALFRQRGFDGLTEGPETYNSFAAITSGAREVVRERVMLLGAPMGTGVTGMPGSLAVIGAGRGSSLGAGRGAILVASRGELLSRDGPEAGRGTRVSGKGQSAGGPADPDWDIQIVNPSPK
ncbi:MAG: hypothetical protein QM682_16745 [Paracoccus sp. (in: a-proteobacteria)]|uniref:hypothetical protein n=1 Tax=Paracoccus sp. TaxID=267 RepID=UPI0039E654CA